MVTRQENTGETVMRALPAIFEAACLIRCTGVGRSLRHEFEPGSGPAPGPGSGGAVGTLARGASILSGGDQAPPTRGAAPADAAVGALEPVASFAAGAALRAVAEFNQPEAAERLSRLLSDLGVAATWSTLSGGGRRRYFVHRVTIPSSLWQATGQHLTLGWRQGRHFLMRTDPIGASSPHNARREALARRAWQAASLAAGRQRRGGGIFGVRLADQEMAAVLVRSARLLGATATIRPRPGCLQVSVTSVDPATGLLEIATPPLRVAV